MGDYLSFDYLSFADGLVARLHGPMSFRLLIQPLMAIFFAFRDGRKDAREGRPPYFWGLFTDPEHRGDMLRSGLKSIGKVFIIAIILDNVFQYIVFHNFRLGAAMIVAAVLALVPYLLLRGTVSRLMRRHTKGEKP
ncbi:MAG TPA: hypothetical protein VLE03_04675 [Nitrospiraceae bacterium]|nr:hypothetical protein [Nitrospiraceae bacterium]